MSDVFKICQLLCEHCHWKLLADSPEKLKGLFEFKISAIPAGAPVYNPKTKKVEVPNPHKQKRKFRCPQCGFGVYASIIQDTQKTYDANVELQKRLDERQKLEDMIARRTPSEENWTDGSKTSSEGS